MLEVEVKIKTDLVLTEKKLVELGFEKGSSEYERDIYYNSEYYDMKKADKAIRIREHKNLDSEDGNFVMNYKGPKLDESTMTREETEFEIPDFMPGDSLLKGLGYVPAGCVEKTRIHYLKGDVTCCLDKVTNLGEFLEVEILSPEDKYDEAVGEIRIILEMLDLKMEDTIRHSYLSMLMK